MRHLATGDQVAFETNSSLGSENFSIDSVQIADSLPTQQFMMGSQFQHN